MGTAPLDRDAQIELMKTAKARHDARVERWKNDETVKRVLRKPPEIKVDGYTSSYHSMRLKSCA